MDLISRVPGLGFRVPFLKLVPVLATHHESCVLGLTFRICQFSWSFIYNSISIYLPKRDQFSFEN